MNLSGIRMQIIQEVLNLPRTDEIRMLPDSSGLYFVFDKQRNEMIYVGQTKNSIQKRIYQHTHARHFICPEEANDKRYWFYYQLEIHNLTIMEAFFIAALTPRVNRIIRTGVNRWEL